VFTGDIANPTQVFSAKADAYWLVNLDARFNMGYLDRKLDKTFLQLNVYNLFDTLYVGGFGGGLTQATSTRTCNATSTPPCVPTQTIPTYGNPPFVQMGAPRTVSMTLNIGF